MNYIKFYIYNLFITLTFLLTALTAKSQIDLKHSLPELLNQYKHAGGNTLNKARYALLTANFYLNNIGYPAALDSALYYADNALAISNDINDKKGTDDALILNARVRLAQQNTKLVQQMLGNAKGLLACRLYIFLGKYYLEKDGSDSLDLNQADNNFLKAERIARKENMPVMRITSTIYRYKSLKERHVNKDSSEKFFNQILKQCQQLGNKLLQAQAWIAKANYAETTDGIAEYYGKASAIAKSIGNKEVYIGTQKEIADAYLQQGKLDAAERLLNNVVKWYEQAGYENRQFAYDLLISVLIKKGNYEAAMRSGIAAVKCAQNTGTAIGLNFFQFRLSKLSQYLGLKKESLNWAKQCLMSSEHEKYYPYGVLLSVEREAIKNGDAKGVLKRLKETVRKHPLLEDNRFMVPLLMAECYTALHQPNIAYRYYNEAVKAIRNVPRTTGIYYPAYQAAAELYVNIGEYKKAEPFLSELFNAPPGIIDVSSIAAIYRLQFKADSASGHYKEAIKHLEASKFITDSIFDHVRLKQTEEIQVQFKTAEKDKENLVLRNKNSLQQINLQKEGLQKKLIAVGLVASILILSLMAYLYRAKQRSNNNLKRQQKEINSQNIRLNELVHEKEWLIKEIHHRVKNNLQIISSLLNTQSAYLENTDAQAAIRDSQNRMQAISIVHQKLYQSEDAARVNFKLYVNELVQSICDSFHSEIKVRFHLDIADVCMETAESVPIGLILNEAITNSIKYAFKEKRDPQIFISLKENTKDQFELVIKDNGNGLPPDFDPENCTSLGINLMTGLASQLSGTFDIRSDNGTVITITFKRLSNVIENA